jgi:hypothetical protein
MLAKALPLAAEFPHGAAVGPEGKISVALRQQTCGDVLPPSNSATEIRPRRYDRYDRHLRAA